MDNAAAAAKSLQLCLTLWDPIDGSLPGSPVPRILQARILEWVAISFCNAWKWKVKVKLLSSAQLLATPWTAAHQAPPSMGFSRQEYWSGLPLPSPITTLNVPKSTQLNIKGYLSCFQLCYYENGWNANCLKNNHFFQKVSSLLMSLSLRHGMFLVKWVWPGLLCSAPWSLLLVPYTILHHC